MKLVSINKVAEFLSIKPDTAYRWASSGYLPCIRMGKGKSRRILRFDLEVVEKWLSEQQEIR